MFNFPTSGNETQINIPSNVQYAIGVDGINVKILPAGTSPNVVYRIGDGTVHPEGWENIDGNKYLDFYISTGATGATGEKGETGKSAYAQAVDYGLALTEQEWGNIIATITSHIDDVISVNNNVANINIVSDNNSNISTVVSNIVDIQNAEENANIALNKATDAELSYWKAEAQRLTADSYATEPEDTLVKLYTSNNDGTFTITNSTEYSSLHWALKSQGATTLSDIKADSIQLNGGTGTQGTVTWNNDEETLDLIQDGAILQLGQELQVHCRNNSGSTILNGTVVMVTGTLGASGRLTISPYTTNIEPRYILGIATEDIANDDDGKVTTYGKIKDIDTTSYTEGVPLYVANNGLLTTVMPSGMLSEPIAFSVNSSHNGTLMVRVPTFISKESFDISYDNSLTGLSSTNVQDAIDEVEIRLDTSEVKLSGIEDNATADQTGSEIKSLYEAEANTNAFTDAEKSKLENTYTKTEIDTNIGTTLDFEGSLN